MKTGFKDLDKIINLNNGELIVLAARPAMGKTTFALNMLSYNTVKENKSTLLFSLEESKETIINKLIISNSMVEANKFKIYDEYNKNNNEINLSDEDWERIAYGVNLLKDAHIFISDKAPYTIDDICKKSREIKLKENIELIIIDYLQLIRFDKKELLSRDDEITEILRRLGVLAKELNVPIVVTSQLSRKAESRENKRPLISDFVKSEYGILTHSNKILFLYRDSYYEKNSKSNITEVIVAKNNEGKIDTIKVAWMPEYCKFGNTIVYKEDENEKRN